MTTTPPAPTVTAYTDAAPCPRAVVLITPMPTDAATVTVWRYANGRRAIVRGASNVPVAGDTAVVDYDLPLGFAATYRVQTADAAGTPSQWSDDSTPVLADSDYLWIHDPLDPSSAMPVSLGWGGGTGAEARFASFRTGTYQLAATLTPVFGSGEPIGYADVRQAVSGVPLEIRTYGPDVFDQLLALLQQAYPLCVRGGVAVPLIPGVAYLSIPAVTPTLDPDNVTATWAMTGDSIAPPGASIIIPTRTWDDVGDEASSWDGLGDIYSTWVTAGLGS